MNAPASTLPLPKSLERWPDPVTPAQIGHCWLQDVIQHYLCRRAADALRAIGSPEPVKVAGARFRDYEDAIAICQSLAARLRAEAA